MTTTQPDVWEPGTVHLLIEPGIDAETKKRPKPYVSEHTCWNKTRFLAAVTKAHLDTGGDVTMLTPAEYEHMRKAMK